MIANPDSQNSKAYLYTVQNIKSLDILKKEGKFTNRKEYIEEHLGDIAPGFIQCYDWFVGEAEKIVKRPEYAKYPIWCSVSPKNCMRPGEDEIGYVLQVPEEEIIYFSGLKWDYVLNLQYVPEDQHDLKAYQDDLKAKGFKNSFEFIKGRYERFFPEETKKVYDSWSRVFEFNQWNIFDIQANIWEIKEEWVKNVFYYGQHPFTA